MGLQVLPESRVDSPARALSVNVLALAHGGGWAMSTTASWALVIPAIFLYIAVPYVCGVFVLPDLSLQVLNCLVLLDNGVKVFPVERVSDVLALSEHLVKDRALSDLATCLVFKFHLLSNLILQPLKTCLSGKIGRASCRERV